jgi:ribosomal-protein-alanine N-acetyltransferase
MIPIKIEFMQVNDLDEVMLIEKMSFPTPWSREMFLLDLLDNSSAYYLVARCRDKVIGYTGFWLIAGEMHIANLAVHPSFRRQKVAHRLLLDSLYLALSKGAQRSTLEVRVSNFGAQKLYENFGFIKAGVRKRYYSDTKEDAIIMWVYELASPQYKKHLSAQERELNKVPEDLSL